MTEDKNNLNELNTILFDTLRGVKDGTVKREDAKAIQELSNSIIHNAKVQLDGFKASKGIGTKVGILGISATEVKSEASNDLYTNKLEFAIFKGHKNLAEAIEKIGKNQFEEEFRIWNKNRL